MAFKLPELRYPFDALKPHIDTRTMKIHHGKHHAGYTKKLNDAIAGTELEKKPIEEILKKAGTYSSAVRNNGGGYYNHDLFWKIMSPEGGGEPKSSTKLGRAMKDAFGDYEKFKEKFSEAAASRFGSGWAWLCVNRSGKLFITSTPNQDNPLMDVAPKKGIPILGLDVWEHSYYLKYQNRRPDYIAAFFNVINWDEVSKRYNMATRAKTSKASRAKKATKAKAK